jgi:lipopolysaccharide/colanic/teichoic acid biosynthesis glycosyltransferase
VVGHGSLGIGTQELIRAVRRARATVLILSDEAIRVPAVVEAAVQTNLAGIRVRDLRALYEREFEKVAVSDLSLSWFLFDVAAIHRRRIYGTLKRGLEAGVAGAVLVLSLPLLATALLAIKLSSPGPVLFRQRRVGRGGEVFTLTKLRTMHLDSTRERGYWAGASRDRVFPVGRLLRRLRIDELPQLVSVLHGNLSLVGPRPEQPEIVSRLAERLPYYPARHCVRPGVTGWAQVNLGYAGSERGALAKLQYDLYYIKHQSLTLDLRVIATTARAIILGSGS